MTNDKISTQPIAFTRLIIKMRSLSVRDFTPCSPHPPNKPQQYRLILQFAPDWLKTLLSSGIAAGGLTAITLNLVFPQEK
ncbi:hypothetical protein [Photorhabdus sp. CRCIA-P01]|uniref:hypothetical protein n=1 Tax=Photorhabdus sp. CRCIA-P01 TaxID=2019570 RepID=UPI000E599893|nr:hypothetical protein [Photorhabdus sp. CRCIA-P01]